MTNTIKVEKRSGSGTNFSKSLRKQGKIPAVVHGSTFNNISVDQKFFNHAYSLQKLISTIHDIEIDGVIEKVMVKEFQLNHMTREVIHIDFIKLEKEKYITARIPLFYINKSKSIAVKKGAMLNVVKYEIFLSCVYDEIPPHLIIDLDGSDVLDKYYVESLAIPKSAKLIKPGQLLANFKGKRGQVLAE